MLFCSGRCHKPAIRLPLIRLLAISGISGSENASKMSFSMTTCATFGHFRDKRYNGLNDTDGLHMEELLNYELHTNMDGQQRKFTARIADNHLKLAKVIENF